MIGGVVFSQTDNIREQETFLEEKTSDWIRVEMPAALPANRSLSRANSTPPGPCQGNQSREANKHATKVFRNF